MKKILILDDQYGRIIAPQLMTAFPQYSFPVVDNVLDPLERVDEANQSDIILLDNYFPGKTWQEPLGDVFLGELLKEGGDYHIVCISDYGETLLDRYDNRKEAHLRGWIMGFVSTKNPNDMMPYL